jgi:hypothetical protein
MQLLPLLPHKLILNALLLRQKRKELSAGLPDKRYFSASSNVIAKGFHCVLAPSHQPNQH